MDTTERQYRFRQGDHVVAADGAKVGKVFEIGTDYLGVAKGMLFPKDYYIPFSAITRYEEAEHVIYLNVTKDQALNSSWDQVRASAGTTSDRAVADGDRMVIPVHEEELIPTKTTREAGEVTVTKKVIAEDQSIDVPVTEERVRVTRRDVDRAPDQDGDLFAEQTIDVPVRAEDVVLEKRTRVGEEVQIDKDVIESTKRVSGTVRKETVDVDDLGDVERTDESSRL